MGLLKSRWNEDAAREWQLPNVPEDIGDAKRLSEAVERRSRVLIRTRGFRAVAKPFVWECRDHAREVAVSAFAGNDLEEFRDALAYSILDDDVWEALQLRARQAASAANLAGGLAQDGLHAAQAALALETGDLAQQGQYVYASLVDGFEADSVSRRAVALGSATVCIRAARACTRTFLEACGSGYPSQLAAAVAVFTANTVYHAAGMAHVAGRGTSNEAARKCMEGLQDELRRQSHWLSERL